MILERMKELEVKYFLLPLPEHPSYSRYQAFVNHTSLASIFQDDTILCFMMSFRFVDLYIFDFDNVIEETRCRK